VIDRQLQSFVQLAESQQGFGVTLTVHGVVVTGNVVSRDDYLQGVTDSAISSWKGERTEGEPLKGVKEVFGIEQTDEGEDLPTYVHLKDAKILLGSVDHVPGGWWRGRLESVDGFYAARLDI
jgi:hypothetical protein